MVDITRQDLFQVDEVTALHVLAVADTIAPSLHALPDGARRAAAIAILNSVARDTAARGSRHIASQRTAGSSVNYRTNESMFTSEDKAALRALTGDTATHAGPLGSFPKPTPLKHVWPEQYEKD